MKPSLQLNISQQLTLTPQLQQAIRLLQLSTLELQQEIQQVVESNPMLEVQPNEEKEESNTENQKLNHEETNEFQWSDLYPLQNRSNHFDDLDINYDNLYCTTTNLQDHMRWQLDLTPMSDVDHAIATTLIDALDDDGFLNVSLEDLQMSLTTDSEPIELAEIEAVRHRLQQFDPVSCFSCNLAETLLVQLAQLPNNEDVILAKKIVADSIDLLGQHNYRQVIKNYHINEATLDKILKVIQGLNPKPGSLIQQTPTQYLIPDIIVKKVNGTWQALLNQTTLPKLSINNHYASLIQRADNSTDNVFLKNNLQEARWFLKSIQSRQETLLRVAQCITDYQKDFLEYGEEAMKPLILNDVALALDMHESTISRVTTQKFMHTPRGVYELKYFFSSHVTTITGGECSSVAIRAFIKKLIAAENTKKPLSDSKIAELIGNQGIQVARRTIAKYREAMGISPSNERKSIRN